MTTSSNASSVLKISFGTRTFVSALLSAKQQKWKIHIAAGAARRLLALENGTKRKENVFLALLSAQLSILLRAVA